MRTLIKLTNIGISYAEDVYNIHYTKQQRFSLVRCVLLLMDLIIWVTVNRANVLFIAILSQ